MARARQEELWRPARDVPFLVLCGAVALSMLRSTDQPSIELALAGTELTLVPADLALAALGALVATSLLGRGALPRPARQITLAAAAFAGWLLLSSVFNGADAVVGAVKFLEFGLLALGVVLFVRRRVQLWLLAGVLVALTVAAVAYALVGFVERPGQRQPSFLGEHDFAALATMSLTLALASLYVRERRFGRLALVAGVAGALGVVLAAALAGLLGLYLALAALVGLAALRGTVTRRALAVTALAAVAVTAGSVSLRSGDLGFLNQWFAAEENAAPGRYAAGWSQRLVYSYVGGRIFLDNPVLGTGWHGELPPSEFARYLPDARRRFPDQPPTYFPRPDRDFIPQQTYDQVLYELGVVGVLLFLVLAAIAVRTVVGVARRWPRAGPDESLAFLGALWVASLAGALAGAALFGGIPLAAIFWLTLGVAALLPTLVPPEPARRAPVERRELAATAP